MPTVETHVDMMTKEAFEQFVAYKGNPCISLYMPTHRQAPEDQQNRIRFKNLLASVRQQLSERGFDKQEIEALLRDVQPLEKGVTDDWQYMSDGFAVFISANLFQTYRLPQHFETFAYIGDRFHIRQLLPIMFNNHEFYILELDLGKSRLLHADRHRLQEVELPDAPMSLAEALKYDDFEREVQLHSTANQGTGDQKALFHGHGTAASEDRQRENILRFLQMLDNAVCNRLIAEGKPLVLAGGDALRGLYRQVNHYEHITVESINHNTQAMNDKELHQSAWKIVAPKLQKQLRQSMRKFQHLSGDGDERATRDLERIVKAAHHQRVDTLFIPEIGYQWGRFDADNNRVITHDQREANDHDLINDATVQTLMNGGLVHTAYVDEFTDANATDKDMVAAILRY